MSLAGFGLTLPGAPTTSIVSNLNNFTESPPAPSAGSCSLNFLGCTTATAGTLNLLSQTGVYTVLVPGTPNDTFTFTTTGITGVSRSPLVGAVGSPGSFVDSITVTAQGSVTDSGGLFQPSAFNMSWSADGSCTGNAGPPITCTATPSGSWAASLSALAQPPPPVPEPASLTLLGAGLVGLGAIRRKFSKKS